MIQRLTMLNMVNLCIMDNNVFNALKKKAIMPSKIIGLLGDKQTEQPHYVSLNSTGVRLVI